MQPALRFHRAAWREATGPTSCMRRGVLPCLGRHGDSLLYPPPPLPRQKLNASQPGRTDRSWTGLRHRITVLLGTTCSNRRLGSARPAQRLHLLPSLPHHLPPCMERLTLVINCLPRRRWLPTLQISQRLALWWPWERVDLRVFLVTGASVGTLVGSLNRPHGRRESPRQSAGTSRGSSSTRSHSLVFPLSCLWRSLSPPCRRQGTSWTTHSLPLWLGVRLGATGPLGGQFALCAGARKLSGRRHGVV